MLEASINERNFLGQGINLNLTGSFSSEKISGIFSYLNPNFLNSNKELMSLEELTTVCPQWGCKMILLSDLQ